jgi:DNA-binding beta-propeller fold protein YncE
MSENTIRDKIIGKKIKFSNLLNIILAVCLILVLIFGYLYYKQINVVDVAKKVVPAGATIEKPNYLYTIYGSTGERFLMPSFTFVDGNNIYVSDTANSRIMVFNYNGKFQFKFSSDGKNGPMKRPSGITSYNNQLYIAQSYKGKIGIYSRTGDFIGYFAENLIKRPSSIVQRDNKFYIIDGATVKIVDPLGKLLLSFGGGGTEPGKFKSPYGLNVDDKGNIYVADSNNFRIQVFSSQGKLIDVWQSKQKDNAGGYTIPRGISFDRKGNVWIAHNLAAGVSVSDTTGKRLALFTESEPGDQGMTLPTSTFIDQNNRLYVTAFGGDRVLVYQIP